MNYSRRGVMNAEFLRAVGPAYINSFSLVMIDSDEVNVFLVNKNSKILTKKFSLGGNTRNL